MPPGAITAKTRRMMPTLRYGPTPRSVHSSSRISWVRFRFLPARAKRPLTRSTSAAVQLQTALARPEERPLQKDGQVRDRCRDNSRTTATSTVSRGPGASTVAAAARVNCGDRAAQSISKAAAAMSAVHFRSLHRASSQFIRATSGSCP